MTNLEQTRTDLRPLLAQALDQTGALIAGTQPAAGTGPTPCSEFDVAALIGHLQGVVRRIALVVSGQQLQPLALGWPIEDRVADWAEGRAAADAALACADLDLLVQVPWGQVPVGAAIGSYVSELSTHGWDLAVATGQVEVLEGDLAEAALPIAMATVPVQREAAFIPFEPVVPVAEDAPAYDRLVGWNGRDPGWRP